MMPVRRAYVLLVLAAPGCGFAPIEIGDADRPLDTSAAWIELEAPLDEPTRNVLEEREGLGLDAAIALALRTNLDLRALRARRGIVEAQLLEAGLLPDPEIDLRALASGAAEVSLLLDVLQGASARGRRLDAARAAVDEVDLEIAAAEWQIACDVRDAWIETNRANARLTLLGRSRELADAAAEAARKASDLGVGSTLTVLDAEAASFEIAASIVEEEVARDEARAELLRLLSLPPSLAIVLSSEPPVTSLPDRVGAFERMRLARFDLRRAEAEHRAALAELALARKEARPLPAFGPTVESSPESGIDPGLELTWSVPLFSGNRGAIAGAAARARTAAEEYVARLATARSEVDVAFRGVEAAERRVATYRDELLPRSRRLIELLADSVARGEVSRLELLRRRREQLVQERSALDAEFELLSRRATLLRAIGPEVGNE